MKLLVTGATGFLGQHLIPYLRQRNIPFATVGRRAASETDEHYTLDLLSTKDLETPIRACQATHLLHLAWYTEHGKYWDSPSNFNWISATYRLVNTFCNAGGQHILVTGTCAEYDWRLGYCNEDLTPLSPQKLYGNSKDITRRLTELVCKYNNVSFCWARIFFPYAKNEHPSRLIPSLFDCFLGKIRPFGVNRHAYRDLMHASDVAHSLLHCAECAFDGTINICSGQPVLLESLVQQIANLCNRNPDCVLNLDSGRPNEPTMLIGDNSKLKQLGWTSTTNLTTGLATYLERADSNGSH
jgi:nucleoside-diphosphate-sugar epimerase